MALRNLLFITEDSDFSSDKAVDDAVSALYVGALHDDAVLDLGVTNCGVVADDGETLIDVRK